jgi:predicted protein tyrosine phosphatase
MNPQDFSQKSPTEWEYKDGTLFVGRVGQTLDQVIAEYLASINEPETPAIPAVCTPRQARLALNSFGLRDAVESWVAAQPQDVKDTWEFATQVRRTDPLVVNAAAALSLTSEQIDALFTTAASL